MEIHTGWMIQKKKQVFSIVHEGHEQKAGFIVGHETNRWVADTSDHNLLLIAPPGAGKTTGVFIPTIYYNARVKERCTMSAPLSCGKRATGRRS